MKRPILIASAFNALVSSIPAYADVARGLAAYNAKDYATAVNEYRQSAEIGDTQAQFRLGRMYEDGLGTPKDLAAAIVMYRKAAPNSADAAMHLADILASDRGVNQDLDGALQLYSTIESRSVFKSGTEYSEEANSHVENARKKMLQMYADGYGGNADIPKFYLDWVTRCDQGVGDACLMAKNAEGLVQSFAIPWILKKYEGGDLGRAMILRRGIKYFNQSYQLPVAQYDSQDSEVNQVRQIKHNLGQWLSFVNPDTRFLAPENPDGVLSFVRYIVNTKAENDFEKYSTQIGTGFLVSPCHILHSYHQIEGFDFIASSRWPKNNRHVIINTEKESYISNSHDPEILKLNNRLFSNDITMSRLSKKIKEMNSFPLEIGTVVGLSLATKTDYENNDDFIVIAGYADIDGRRRIVLDFCNPKSVAQNYGVMTNCIGTPGMSGGPIIHFQKTAKNDYRKLVLGIFTLGANSDGTFYKDQSELSTFAPFTPSGMKKIHNIIDRKTDDKCQPVDGKPW